MTWTWILGASSGIGNGIAHSLAGEGYNVLLAARRKELLEQNAEEIRGKYGVEARPVRLDVLADETDESSLQSLFEQYKSDEPYAIVNAIGVGQSPETEFENIGRSKLEFLVSLNLTSDLRVKQGAKKVFGKNGGVQISMGSHAAKKYLPGQEVYGATKAGMERATRNLAHEARGTSSYFFVVHPTHVDTEMVREEYSSLKPVWDEAPTPRAFSDTYILPIVRNPEGFEEEHGPSYVAQTVSEERIDELLS